MRQECNIFFLLLALFHSQSSAFHGCFNVHSNGRTCSFQSGLTFRQTRQARYHKAFLITTQASSKQQSSLQFSSFDLRSELEEAQSTKNLTQACCDALLAKCIAQDEWDLVLEVMEVMKASGHSQVKSTYTASLEACRIARNPGSAKEMLSAMKLSSFAPTMEDYAIVIDTMCDDPNGSYWEKALNLQQESVINSDQDLPLQTYEGLVSALSRNQKWREIVRLVRFMESRTNSTQPSIRLYRDVIECCASCRQADLASQVLLSCKLVPTTGMFETVIAALCQQLQWRRAMGLLDYMERLGVSKSRRLYNALLTSCARAKEPAQAKALLVRMRKRDMIRPNIVSFNSVMAACVGARQWKDALSILDQAHREPGVTPDLYTYTNAIRACAKGRQTSRALTLLEVVKDKGFDVDAYCYTAAIEACDWRKALNLLQEMEDNGVAPTAVTFSVVIKACGSGGQWEKALELLDKMRNLDMKPNLFVYNAAITAVAKASKRMNKGSETTAGKLYNEIHRLLQQMREDDIEPDGFSYSSAISCCGSEGMWEEAMALMNLMQQGGPKTQPNKVAYTAAITSCAKAKQTDKAIRLFQQMKDQGLSPDIVAYNALFAALRIGKRADEAFQLWDEMMGRSNQAESRKHKAIATTAYKVHPDIITVTE